MKRRTFLKATAVTPLIATPETVVEDDAIFDTIAEGFFDALPNTKKGRNTAVIECANGLCRAKKAISKKVFDAVIAGGDSAMDIVRRLQFGVRILNEYILTDTIDESMIEKGRRNLSKATRYIPLIGSFNRLCETACTVDASEPDAEAITDFFYATIAFGIEVALWTVGAPYKMAWNGTRFIANRTFLRFARYGCRGCIALMMGELHWAIRASIYGHGVTESKVEFVWEQIKELKEMAQEIDYDIDLDYSYEEIRAMIESDEEGGVVAVFPQENEGFIDRLVPDFDFEIDLPSLADLME